jgi:hypothetical protein
MASSFVVQLIDALETSWPAVARPNQLPPPNQSQPFYEQGRMHHIGAFPIPLV